MAKSTQQGKKGMYLLLPEKLHKRIKIAALLEGKTLQQFLREQLEWLFPDDERKSN